MEVWCSLEIYVFALSAFTTPRQKIDAKVVSQEEPERVQSLYREGSKMVNGRDGNVRKLLVRNWYGLAAVYSSRGLRSV